jgi:hypothetical protein
MKSRTNTGLLNLPAQAPRAAARLKWDADELALSLVWVIPLDEPRQDLPLVEMKLAHLTAVGTEFRRSTHSISMKPSTARVFPRSPSRCRKAINAVAASVVAT